ncbi:MAG TPA: VapE domain-containing protein [Candidatus Binatia bacterium]|nr:VapE domain-containing protein [Candidatus Binatia bacterium]
MSEEAKGRVGTEILATELAKRYGFYVFPVFEYDKAKGDCTCPHNSKTRAETGKCSNPGKHPATPNGFKDGTIDPDQIKVLWKKRPFANIGIWCKNLVVLDVDMHNVDGMAALRELEAKYGKLPETVQSLTGGGGVHYIFKKPDNVKDKLKQKALVPGAIDIRGEGGYVVAPPSLHASGKYYEWETDHHPEDLEIAKCPAWVTDRLASEDREFEASLSAVTDGFMGKAFQAAGWLGINRAPGTAAVLCPWLSEHTVGEAYDGSTVVFAPNAGEVRGWFHCSHSHCSHRTQAEVLEQLPAHAKRIATEVTQAQAQKATSDSDATELEPDWRQSLRQNEERRVTKEAGNAALMLAHLDEWKGVFAWSEFADRAYWTKAPPPIIGMRKPRTPGYYEDKHTTYVKHWLSLFKKLALPKESVLEAVIAASQERSFHPVRDYLSSLEWDREPRLDTMLAAYFGAEHTGYTQRVGAAWMIAAVARVFDPGCKVDTMPVLEGDQGQGKSQALRILAGPWFSDHLPSLESKDSQLTLSGVWIVEWGELAGISKHDAERVKQFITIQIDRYRAPFERVTGDHPRQCIFVGTSNHDTYLRDHTGNRRFWPVRCRRLNLAALEKDRDQLWAEAVARYRAREPWWLDREGQELAGEEQQARRVQEPWLPFVAQYLRAKEWATVAEILTESKIAMDRDKITQNAMTSVAACLRELGWMRYQRRIEGVRVWGYSPASLVGKPLL